MNLILGLCVCLPIVSLAQNQPNTIIIKNHQFIPAQLTVPAGKKLQVTVDNQDPTPEEFESSDLDREQIVQGNHQITVFIGPLDPGTYHYWGDFHQDTTKGVIIAK
jgi:plastocyanin